MKKFKILGKKKIYGGAIFDLVRYNFELPDKKETFWDIIEHYGAVVIIPVTDTGDLVMVRQYRPGPDAVMLELPAGKLDHPNENKQACALRELEEETGYRASRIEPLLEMYPVAAYCTEKMNLFLAEDLTPGKPSLDDDEFVEVELHSVTALLDMIDNGEILDMKTILGVQYYARFLERARL